MMKLTKALSSFFALFILLMNVSASSETHHEFVVKFKFDTEIEKGWTSKMGASQSQKLKVNGSYYLLKFEKDQDEKKILNRLNQDDFVEYAEKNIKMELFDMHDGLWSQQWSFNNTGEDTLVGNWRINGEKGADIGIYKAWQERPDLKEIAKDIIVAVIDTGVALNHRDLVDNLWVNEGEEGPWEPSNDLEKRAAPNCQNKSCNRIDDDENGHVDDYRGKSFAFVRGFPNAWEPHDDIGHGTHVAGVIGASHNNLEIAGINAKVKLMVVKFLGGRGAGKLSQAIESIQYAVDMGASVINASWGTNAYTRALGEAVAMATQNGVLFVAAAGNLGINNDLFPSYPADYPIDGLVNVGSSEWNDRRSNFSNFSANVVDLFAPGHHITSTYTRPLFATLSGTSMAAPHVVGVAALAQALYPELKDDPKALEEYLIKTSDKKLGLIGLSRLGSRVSAYNVVNNRVPVGNDYPRDIQDSQWISQDYHIESEHPYGNGENMKFSIHVPGAKWIKVHFGRHNLQREKDYVALYDRNIQLFDAVNGYGVSKVSVPIKGDTVNVVFTSDNETTRWGFEIKKIEYVK